MANGPSVQLLQNLWHQASPGAAPTAGFCGFSAAFGTFLTPQHDIRCTRECRKVIPAALTCEPALGTALLLWGFIPSSIHGQASKSIC